MWDQVGERFYETGVDHGVLYIPNAGGQYVNGVPWNGLTTVTESPSGAEATPQYADNIKYLNLVAAEEFGGTIEAFTYPDEFEQCDGTASPVAGVSIGQQSRKTFGLSYRTLIGNDVDGTDYGYKIHLVWGALAAPSEKARATVNDSPEALALSWEFTTTAVEVGLIEGTLYKPSATLTINSSRVDATALNTLLDILYGTVGTDPRLPLPAEVFALFSGTVTEATPTEPSFVEVTNTITIPTIAGVVYYIEGVAVTGAVVITEYTLVTAIPENGYKFPVGIDTDWGYVYTL
jgi:hypothetical protein